mmetsp:Transcript_91560/g.236356  ORF Transcript_91560/g.236356 Transcript_91560/m.236356 type:complete len:477 (+) Transcript_91560:96-1526(+)
MTADAAAMAASFEASSDADAADKLGLPPPGPGSDGWPAFWTVASLETMSAGVMLTMITELAVQYYSGWTDPCANGGQGTEACNTALDTVARVGTVFGVISSTATVFATPMMGMLADLHGRRAMAFVCQVASVVNKLACCLVGIGHWSIYFLFVSSELVALTPITMPMTLWITDKTAPEERPSVFGRYQSLTALEGIVVPFVAGVLTIPQTCGFLATCSCVALAALVFALPESMHQQGGKAPQQLPHTVASDTAGVGGQLLSRLQKLRQLFTQPHYAKVLCVAMLAQTAQAGTGVIMFLYLKERFGVTLQSVAPLTAVSMASALVANVVLIGPLQRWLGVRGIMLFSMCAAICSSVGIILTPSFTAIYPLAAVYGLITLSIPVVTSVMTNVVEQSGDDLGSVMGGMQGLCYIGTVVGPLAFRMVFLTQRYFNGGVYMLAILLQATTLGIILSMDPRDMQPMEAASLTAAARTPHRTQ